VNLHNVVAGSRLESCGGCVCYKLCICGGQALHSIALMTGLQSLDLSDCSNITNNAILSLSTLTGLQHLGINRFPLISDKGLAVVEHLKLLQSISVYACVKVWLLLRH
jgi:hypothetical protein